MTTNAPCEAPISAREAPTSAQKETPKLAASFAAERRSKFVAIDGLDGL